MLQLKKDNILSTYIRLALVSIIFVISLFLFYLLFFYLQISIFGSKKDLIFVEPNLPKYIFIIYGAIVLILIMSRFQKENIFVLFFGKIRTIQIIPTFTAVSILSLLFLINQFFCYNIIRNNEIIYRQGIAQENKKVSWNDITKVSVYCEQLRGKSSDRLLLHYDIELTNGKVINLYNADNFIDKILHIDTLIRERKINIYRGKPDLSQRYKLIHSFNS